MKAHQPKEFVLTARASEQRPGIVLGLGLAILAVASSARRQFAAGLNRAYSSKLVPAINETDQTAETIKCIAALNEALTDGDWIRVTPYGEFKNKIGIQVVDRASADAMVSAFNSVASKLSTLWRGLPSYEGHPDHPEWHKVNPGMKPMAVGRLKELQARDDGLWTRIAWNDKGEPLVHGEAPAYTGQSPHWGMVPIAGRKGAFRPVELYSLGLTNTPNIAQNHLGLNEAGDEAIFSTPMKPEILALLAALGRNVAPTVTDDQLNTAINEATPVATQLVKSSVELATAKEQL
ncbi:MAG: phage protease, partial [Opitutaceae bacterium]